MAKKETTAPVADAKTERLKVLQLTLDKIDKDFGKGTIMKLGDKAAEDIPSIPTGSIGLDAAIGVGGYPRGRVIEIFGPESSGKTTLAIHAIAEAQKLGGIAAIIDAEHAFDGKEFGAGLTEAFVDEVIIPNSDSMYYEYRNKIDKLLDDTKEFATTEEEIQRFTTNTPLQGYRMATQLWGDRKNRGTIKY